MLIHDLAVIGNKMLTLRKKAGFTQADVAELAGLSDRTYADIERGNVNMRVETLLHICDALKITPDSLLTEENTDFLDDEKSLHEQLELCSLHEQATALKLLSIYLQSLK